MDTTSNVDLKPNDDSTNLCGSLTEPVKKRDENNPPMKSGNETNSQCITTIHRKPIKPNSRLDKFCRAYVYETGKNATEAYRKSGGKNKNPNVYACKLLKKDNIKSLIAVYEKQLMESMILDRPSYLLKIRDFAERCRKAGRLSEEAKALQIEADVLSLKSPETNQQINVFANIDEALKLFDNKSKAIDV